MKVEQKNNLLSLHIEQNFEPMVAYLYLMVFEFVSNGLFVPSINPAKDNVYMPAKLLGKEQNIEYFKNVKMLIDKKVIQLTFETIEDATIFKDAVEQSW
jgi:hypothetical protein